MIRVVVLTCSPHGTASRCIPALAASSNIELVGVILSEGGGAADRSRVLKMKIRKALKIGVLGALNGIRIRRWFQGPPTEEISSLCNTWNIPFHRVGKIKSKKTIRLFREFDADLGLSLGNGFISRAVFSIPKFGMLNVHTERLPEYQNAQSIIWPIYNMERVTGITIHEVDDGIDTGKIILKMEIPIIFSSKLRDTVVNTVVDVSSRVPEHVVSVCENFDDLRLSAKSQPPGRRYITPTIWNFLKMMSNNRRLYNTMSAKVDEVG